MKEFIVWDKDDKQWLTTGNMPIIPIEEEIELKLEDNESTSFHQFIGKTDINRKKIYDNCSIVEFNYDNGNGYFNKVVGYFYIDNWQYRLKVIKSTNCMGVDNLPMAYQNPKDLKVIGTIQQDNYSTREDK